MSELLPHDLAAEQALIGWCLLSPAEAWRVLDRVTPAEMHRPGWQAALAVLRAGHVTVADLAERADIDPGDAVSALAAAPMRHEIDRLVERVLELAARRRVIEGASEAVDSARDLSVDPSVSVERLRETVEGLDTHSAAPLVEVDEFLAVSDDPYDWVIPDLLERGDRMLVTAGEGHGKSVMLRQMAVGAAAGVHPWRLSAVDPRRVLLVDVENVPRKVRRELRPLVTLAERTRAWNPGNLAVEVRVGGLDLARGADQRWLGERVTAHKPDLVVIGPLYQLHGAPAKGDHGGEDHARRLARTLDRLRERFGCALLMETHAPHAQAGARDLRPFGSSVWLRWPEFGLGLRRDREHGEKAFELVHWRGPRDRRDWPKRFEWNTHGGWPWIATYEHDERRTA